MEAPSWLNRPLQFDSRSGTATLVGCGKLDHSLPVLELTHLELAGIPVIILAPYCPPIGADLTACFGSRLPVLMPGDLNTKHTD